MVIAGARFDAHGKEFQSDPDPRWHTRLRDPAGGGERHPKDY